MKKKTAIWVGAGIGCLGLLVCVALVGFFLLVRSGATQKVTASEVENKDISVKVISPAGVKVGDPFVLELQISNASSAPQQLDSIDIYETYLQGIELKAAEPAYTGMREITLGDHYNSYDFQRLIPANETVSVKFQATAKKFGVFSGLVFVCAPSETICNIYRVETTIGQ